MCGADCQRRERQGLWSYLSHDGVPGADVIGPAIQAGLGGPLGVIGQAGVGWICETEAPLRLPVPAHGEHPGLHGGVGWRAAVVGGGGGCEDLQQVVVGHAEDGEAQQDRVQELERPIAGHAVHKLGKSHGARQDEPGLQAGGTRPERGMCAREVMGVGWAAGGWVWKPRWEGKPVYVDVCKDVGLSCVHPRSYVWVKTSLTACTDVGSHGWGVSTAVSAKMGTGRLECQGTDM